MIEGRLKLAGLDRNVRAAAEWALAWADYYQVPVTITSGFRSWADQERLYTNYVQCVSSGDFGHTPDCQYPANRPGDSAHNYGWAWDSVVPSRYQDWWDYVRRAAGFEILSNDRIHAQVPNWRQYV